MIRIILTLSLILILVLIYSLIKKTSIDRFTDRNRFNVYFFNKEESCYQFKNFHNTYFSSFKSIESIARNCIRNENEFDKSMIKKKCQKFYCQNVFNFEKEDMKNIIYVLKILKKISPDYFNKYFRNWKFIKVSNLIEGELPHTINDCIVLPQLFISQMNNYIKEKDKFHLIKYTGSTLLHEYIHIIQKQNPKIFNILYTNYWNMVYFKKDFAMQYIGKYQRLNPDGLDTNWVFKIKNDEYLLPYVMLKSNKLENIDRYGLLIKNNKVIKNEKLLKFTEYTNFFCNITNNYHPNELSASLISEYLLNEYFNHDIRCPGLRRLIQWMKIYFK